jgi:predicted GIY-YIG superfamily endonuclease
MYVYLLQSNKKYTYVGATVNLERRLRQHNKEIKGGAKATGRRVLKGETWTRVVHVSEFPDWQSTLQFEWRWKQLTRKIVEKNPLKRRLLALQKLIALPQSTKKAVPFEQWVKPPEIHFETEEAKEIYAILDNGV